MSEQAKDIAVAAAIESLRHELTEAMQTGDAQRERMRFRLDEPIVLELHAAVTWTGDGKLGWKIIEIGGSRSSADTHTLTLRLKPEWWDGSQYTTDFRISASIPSVASRSSTPSAASPPDGAVVPDAVVDHAPRLRLEGGVESG